MSGGGVEVGVDWEALRAQAALFKLPSLLRRIERLLDSQPASE